MIKMNGQDYSSELPLDFSDFFHNSLFFLGGSSSVTPDRFSTVFNLVCYRGKKRGFGNRNTCVQNQTAAF